MTAQTKDLGKDGGKQAGKTGKRREGVRLVSELRRVRNLAELFGEGYAWDGNCQCGADDWQSDLWERGHSGICRHCGGWVCYHELDGTAHNSDGLWCPQGRARHTSPPSGCPLLTDTPGMGT